MRISSALLLGTSALAFAAPAFAQTGQEAAAQAATEAPDPAVSGRDHRHRDQARIARPGRAVLDQRADPGRHPARQCADARGYQPQRRRPHRPEPRARPEPGFDPRRVGRPDRPRPAGRQGAGRRLSRRKRDLAVAVHARLRPVRPQPRRDAARSAGHVVRLRLGRRHDPLHHQPAQARTCRRSGRGQTSTSSTAATSAMALKGAVQRAARQHRSAARRRL